MLEAIITSIYPSVAFLGEIIVFWVVWKTLDFFFHQKIENFRKLLEDSKAQPKMKIVYDEKTG